MSPNDTVYRCLACGRRLGQGQRPLLDFPERVQDLGDVLESVGPQGWTERYVDYAERLLDAMDSVGWVLIPPPNGSLGAHDDR